MAPAEEALATELNCVGGAAWSKLHDNLPSQLLVPIERDGAAEQLPMSAMRNLAYEPDRAAAPARLRGRAGRLEARRAAAGRRAQQHQGRGQHAGGAPRLGLAARRRAVGQPASTARRWTR